MRAINHALTGAIIGTSLAAPIALPLALVSHFVCDFIPHFDADEGDFEGIDKPSFKTWLLLDALACLALVFAVWVRHPAKWLLIDVCAFLAASPDLMWVRIYVRSQKGRYKPKLTNPIMRFHSAIQWFAKPAGIVVELPWFIGATFLLNSLLH